VRVPQVKITLIGGPTALIEVDGYRLLTDPTFDPPSDYQLPYTQLRKTGHPAIRSEQILPIDAVLLSHDQHFDNLDRAGRTVLARAARVLTTTAAASRLGSNAEGLAPWATTRLTKSGRAPLLVTGTPARHGPAGIEPLSGEVTGFLLAASVCNARPLYITGDTVWYEGIADVARRFGASVVMAFAGAARTRGPFRLTMDTNEVIELASAFGDAVIVPLHVDGWAHLTQTAEDIAASFRALGLASRLRLPRPGTPMLLELPASTAAHAS
jgi:L-ascorbate metabolism protein UlaG (beta-lactamase superfamily)